jgi:hypothetical protein
MEFLTGFGAAFAFILLVLAIWTRGKIFFILWFLFLVFILTLAGKRPLG